MFSSRPDSRLSVVCPSVNNRSRPEWLNGLWYYTYFFTFLRFFFKIQKHDFLRFFELLHTFSRTLCPCVYFIVDCGRAVVDGVPAEPLHSHGASAQNTSIHVPADTPAGRTLRLRLRTDTLPQDGLPRSTPGHAAHTVTLSQFRRIGGSGVTKVGDTRGGNWGCHPSIFFLKKPGDRFLVASSAVPWRPFLLIALSLFIAFTRVSPPRWCHPTPFLPVRPPFSTILCKFAHKNFFPSGVTPWRVSPGAVRPSPPSDATDWGRGCMGEQAI